MKKVLALAIGILLLGAGCTKPTEPINTTPADQSIRTHEAEILAAVRIDAKADLADNSLANELSVEYGDVTHDTREDAWVTIPSGGTAGVTAVLVYGFDNGKVHLLQRIDGYKMTVRTDTGNLLITEYDPEDMNKITDETYTWDGTKFNMTDSKNTNVSGE